MTIELEWQIGVRPGDDTFANHRDREQVTLVS